MSRVGYSPIELPDGVTVEIDGTRVVVTGARGALQRTLSEVVTVSQENGVLKVDRVDETRTAKALHGLSRALLANMVAGVSTGFRKELQIVGVGYRAALKGGDVELQVGYSHPVTVVAPEGVAFEVPDNTKIIVTGIDKELVGQTAANIRRVRPPEPYKGKGIRYAGEHVRRKAGKAGIAR